MHAAIDAGLVRSCHDLSEGGLAVAVAEMAFAGGLGALVEWTGGAEPAVALFSESNTRFVCEIEAQKAGLFERMFTDVPLAKIGSVIDSPRLLITSGGKPLIDAQIAELKKSWQAPLKW
jgi:phosphoribosylformylglycinamidine synthase